MPESTDEQNDRVARLLRAYCASMKATIDATLAQLGEARQLTDLDPKLQAHLDLVEPRAVAVRAAIAAYEAELIPALGGHGTGDPYRGSQPT